MSRDKKQNIEAVYTLSPLQEGMLFHTLYAPESGVYVQQVKCTFKGDLRVDALRGAWQRVLNRHTVLRTAFVWQRNDKPLQVVWPGLNLPWEQADWRHLPAVEHEDLLEKYLIADRQRGFDVTKPPLMRCALMQTTDETYEFIWSHHHIVLDGWSISLVFNEVFAIYQALRRGGDLELQPPTPFRDYIGWLKQQDLKQAESFWRAQLRGFETPTILGLQRQSQNANPTEIKFEDRFLELSADATEALKSLARQHRLTVNTLLLGAWGILLSRYSGMSDVLVGATVSGRPAALPGIENMVGLFINTLPVRLKIDEDRRLIQWLCELQSRQVEMQQYEYSPLILLQEWSDVPRGTNLFESIYGFENYPLETSRIEGHDGLQILNVRSAEQTSYPLSLMAWQSSTLTFKLTYDTQRFDASTITRMLGHLHLLLDSIVSDPDQSLAQLHLLTPAEHQFLVIDANDTAHPFPHLLPLHHLFEQQVARSPSAVALTFEDNHLTYSQLDERANRLAHFLRQHGVGPDTLVAVFMHRSVEMVVALLGILKAGAAYVPLDPEYPRERLLFMLADAQTEVILTQASLVEDLPEGSATVVALDTGWDEISACSSENPQVGVEPDHLAYVIYTSGSTGRPKAAMNTHRAIVNRLCWMQSAYGLSSSDRVLQKTPFSFDVSVWEFFWPLLSGARLVMARPGGHRDSAYLVGVIVAQEITTLHFVPSMLEVFVEEAGVEGCVSVRRVISSGEALPVELVERYYRRLSAPLHNLYGPTEAAVDVSAWECRRDGERERVPIGRPIWNTQLYVLDERMRAVPVGVTGELYIGGVGVCRGYYRRPELTAERFVPDPFDTAGGRLYRTGDVARYREDGAVEYVGRVDAQVKVRGYRIELGEIESVVREQAGVRECVVVARGEGVEKRLVGYVVGDGISIGEIRRGLSERLPEYMVPQVIMELEELPLTPNGKVDRRALPEPEHGQIFSGGAFVAARTPVEEILVGIWKRVIGVEQVGVFDDFFELGGHSLLGTQIVSRVRESFKVALSLRNLFEQPTVARLAEIIETLIRGGDVQETLPIKQISREQNLPLSYAQQRLWFLSQFEADGSGYNMPSSVRLTGKLDIEALERSLSEVVRRHEVLRTTFTAVNGEPIQIINPPAAVRLTVTDLSSLPDEARAAETRRLATDEAQLPFDLARDPLLRASLLRLAEEDHVVLLTMHHIASDGWSIGILMREVAALYEAFSANLPSPLPELEIQYADYANWQREWLQGDTLERELSYWRKQLAGAPAVLELPTDKARPAVQSFRGAQQPFALSSEVAEGLRELSRKEGVTLFMTLLAAFQTLLHRYSGQDDLVVGLPIANRHRAETENLIGLFVNTLPIRAQVSPRAGFRELLKRVREVTLGAYAHQELPFEQLVKEVQPERHLDRQALFQSMFIFQNVQGSSFELTNLSLNADSSNDAAIVRTDLDLYVWDAADGLSGNFIYSTDLFDAGTITRLSERWRMLVEEIIREPDASISNLLSSRDMKRLKVATDIQTSERVALSYHQERLWFIDQFETGNVYEANPVYHNIPLVLHLTGEVDDGTLESSLNDVVARHAALRTRIVTENGHGWQVISPSAELKLRVQSLESSAKQESGESLPEQAWEEARRPFALDRDLLIRAALFRTNHVESLLVLTLHHIIADRHSLRIIADELAELYCARKQGRRARLQEAVIQYAQFASNQLGYSRDELEPLLFYWKWQLRGKVAALELPEDRKRPAVHTYSAARHAFHLNRKLTERLRFLGQEKKADLFAVVLTAFKVLLHRYAQQNEIAVGTSVPYRDHPEFGNVVGPLANLLVLRSDLGGNPTLGRLLEEIKRTVEQARAHQEMPFDKLVQDLDPENDMSRTALFDVLFQLDDREAQHAQMDGVSARVIETNYGYGKYDLNLSMQGQDGGLNAVVVYNADIYDRFTVRQMMRHLETLLEAAAANPEGRIDDIKLLSADEEQTQLVRWNSTQASYPADKTVHQLFEDQVGRTPENTALVFAGERLNYRQLDERANQLAHYLRAQGVGPDMLVGLCLNKSTEMIVALLAVLKAGGAYLPLDPSYPEDRLRFMLEDSGAAHLITTTGLSHTIPSKPLSVVLLDADRQSISAQPRVPPGSPARPSHLAYCIYTSGSTGKSKGVLLEHRNVVRLMVNDRMPFVFTGRDVWSMFHSYCFDFSVWEMYGALLYGGKLVVVPEPLRKDPSLFLELLADEKVTVLNQTPTAFNNLSAAALKGSKPLSLRYVIFGGETLRPIQLREWKSAYPAVTLVNMYGITETTVHVTFKEITDSEIEDDLSNIGSPIPTTSAYILDANLRLLPVGVRGEVCVGGGGVSRGYLNRDELTRQKFVPNPYEPGELIYRSGDIGRYLPNGEIIYIGRSDEQVQIRGFRVEPGEIQSHLLAHPSIASAEVLARTINSDALELVAYVVPSAEVGVTDLRNYLAGILPHYMVPSAFVFMDALPLTPNGKVDRRALPLPTQLRPDLAAVFVSPRTPTEEILAGIWLEVLGLEKIGINDNFFDLGGHSLLATQVISRVRERFQVELPLRSLFEQPTIAGLADVIQQTMRAGQGSELPPISSVPRDGYLPLSFAQQRLWFVSQLEPAGNLFNVPVAVRLTGKLDTEALERSLGEIVRRHEVLRTTFTAVNGEPIQIINPPAAVRLTVTDLSSLPDETREAETRRLATDEAQLPFDLARDPLLRASLLRLAQEDHVVLLTMHHIASDGWSMGILVREVAALYEAFSSNLPSPLPELEIQYADYANWQREWLQGETLERELSYWRKQLAGAPAVLELPTDRARPAVQSFRGAQQSFALSEELTRELKELSRSEGVTLFMTLLAAFQTLLYRYSGQEDIVVGTDVANRNRYETEGLMGFFINQLVLRTEMSGEPSFRELLGRVREVTLGAYAHQELPFEKLVEELNPRRDASRGLLFQVKLVLQNTPVQSINFSNLSLTPLEIGTGVAQYDLILNLMDTEHGMVGSLTYKTDLFEAASIARLQAEFETVLKCMVSQPDMHLHELAQMLVELHEQERLLREKQFEETRRLKLKNVRRKAIA